MLKKQKKIVCVLKLLHAINVKKMNTKQRKKKKLISKFDVCVIKIGNYFTYN